MSNVPKLRFKEFSGAWEENKLGDCIELLTDYHANGSYERLKENVELLDAPNYAIMIRTTNFEQNDFSENLIYITENAYHYLKKSKVYEDDIVINKIANAGATYLMPKIKQPVSLGMNIFLLRANSSVNKKFLYSRIKWQEYRLKALSSGTSTKTITKDDVRGFKVKLPSKQEQEKIALFLTSVDTKIKHLTKKNELLKQYKKGVMQQLFSQEIRFKVDDGSEFPAWEEKKLGDLLKEYSDKDNSALNEVVSVGKYGIRKRDEIYSKELSKNISKNKVIFKNTLSIGMGSTQIDIGILLEDKIYSVSPAYSTFHIIKTDSYFLEQLLIILNKKLSSLYMVTGARQGKSVNKGDFLNHDLFIPTLEEQTKIANFLSLIDSKIEQVTKQLDSTKEFKKALLQKMFV